MDETTISRALTIFREVIEVDEARRRRMLGDLKEREPALYEKVRALLAADADPADFLDTPAAELAGGELFEDLHAHREIPGHEFGVGQRLGPWLLEEQIGRGGTSLVFRARRADDTIDQTAALKLFVTADLAEGAGTFRREQNILAGLRHPNIATLIDVGATDGGIPYFVMDLVEGRPLTDHSVAQSLDTRGRVDLFLQVCAAVDYAHRHLIVHRDLKPANILVDTDGNVRLLDFGIAKLLEEGERTQTVRMLTPAYAAPEQLRGESVTTATDVFGLGVVLHELLTGAPPDGFEQRTPIHPSPTLTALPLRDHAGESLSEDLGRILGKALHDDPQRRYATAREFAEDLQRWLRREPVTAGPDGLRYRLSLFVRRNLVAVVAGAAVAAALLIGGSAALWQARVARAESVRAVAAAEEAQEAARRAEVILQFLLETFSLADPGARSGDEVTATEILDAGLARIEGDQSLDEEDRLQLLQAFARVSYELGDQDRAEALIARVLDSPQLAYSRRAAALDIRGTVARQSGNLELAEKLFREALDVARSSGARADEAAVRISLAALLNSRQDPEGAMETLAPLIPTDADGERLEVDALPRAHLQYAAALAQLQRYDEAAEVGYRALEGIRSGGNLTGLSVALTMLAGIEDERGELDRAIALEREGLQLVAEEFGHEHTRTLAAKNNLAILLQGKGELEAAIELLEEFVAASATLYGPSHPDHSAGLFNLGRAQSRAGRHQAALENIRRAVEIREAHAASDPLYDIYRTIYGRTLARIGRHEDGLAQTAAALRAIRVKLGDDHPVAAKVAVEHGGLLNDLGREREALQWLEPAEPILEGAYGADSADLANGRVELARALAGSAESAAALEKARSAIAIFEQSRDARRYDEAIEMARALVRSLESE